MNPEETVALGPLVEADGNVGAWNDDGTVNVAIIRPCTSRGRRLKGLPPIYSQEMLREEADAFSGWRMYMGHLTPEMAKAMRKAGRTIEDLGGRVVESWWNPDYVTDRDSTHGFQSGAIMGKVIPYPAVKALLEADPKALAVSINAWPKGAKPGVGANGEPGMVIEGFRRAPEGSVDWVISPGAGGGLAEEERAVSLLESIYDPAHEPAGGPGGDVTDKLSEMTEDEFRAHVAKEAPHLLDTLAEGRGGGLDEDTVQAMLDEQAERFEAKLAESVEEQAAKLIDQRDQYTRFSTRAQAKIRAAEGLTDGHRADLLSRYDVADGKPAAGLLVESVEALDGQVEDDVKHALDLISESRPKARVTGLGTGADVDGDGPKNDGGHWTDTLQEMGVMPVDGEGKSDKSKLLDGMVN